MIDKHKGLAQVTFQVHFSFIKKIKILERVNVTV